MSRWVPLVVVMILCLASWGQGTSAPPPNQPPPRSEPRPEQAPPLGPGESSSKDPALSPPPREPESGDSSDVSEFHSWDPHRAAKHVEVGDFNFKHHRYLPALSRYCEALEYKPGDAVATLRTAEVLEKLGDLAGAEAYYEDYLKILPNGPQVGHVRRALEHIRSLPERPSKHLAQRQGCEAPGGIRTRPQRVDPERPTLTRNPTSPPEGKSP
jgi:tetratricopeptide (TPR) repeat protein